MTALLLLAAMIFASCANSASGNSTQTTAPSGSDTTATEEVNFDDMTFIERLTYDRSNISDGLPAKDYDGYTYTVAFLDQGEGSNYHDEWVAEKLDGEVVNDAVYNRNHNVMDRFNIDIAYYPFPNSDNYSGLMAQCVTAGDDVFDMISLHPAYYSAFIYSGYMTNLSDLEYLDTSKPWWMTDSIKSYSYHNNYYTAFGVATALTVLGDSPVMFFNKDLASDNGIGSLYDVVNNGGWTCEYVSSLIKNMWVDVNGDGTVGSEDTFGMFYIHPNETYRIIWSLGGRYVMKDANDEPYLDVNNEKMLNIFETVREMSKYDGTFYNKDYESSNLFTGGQALLWRSGMGSVDALRDVSFDFGILPNYKLDENQENYLTNGGGGPQGIPVTCQDTERASIVMEALNSESYKLLIPAYYETAVKTKYTYDEESAEMLDLIFSNVVYDPSYVFCHSLTYALGDYVLGSKEFASWYSSVETSAQGTLESNIASYTALIGG